MSQLNYSNQNLQNSSFAGQNLTGANFAGSDLRGCNFTGAILSEASFEGAKTGQSRRQAMIYIAAAIVGPFILVGFSVMIVQLFNILLPDRANSSVNFLLKALLILSLLLGHILRDRLIVRFPLLMVLLGNTAIAALLMVMIIFTTGVTIVSVSHIWQGAVVQGVLMLLLAVVAAIITFRIFIWLRQALQNSPGTSFRKANLTHANFSYAVIENTDFSQAVLTGACLLNWVLQSHVQFNRVYCEYLYLEPTQQNRYPSEGHLQPGELDRVLFRHRLQ